MRLICAALAMASLPAPAAAERWFYVTQSDLEQVYADLDSLETRNAVTGIDVFSGLYDAYEDDNSIWYIVDRYEFRCGAREVQVSRSAFFDADRALAYSDDYDPDWEPVQDDSIGSDLYAFTCERARDTAQEVADPFDDTDAANAAADAASEAAEAAADTV